MELEAVLIALLSSAISIMALWAALMGFQSTLTTEFGLQISVNVFSLKNLAILALVLLATVIVIESDSIHGRLLLL